MSGIVLAFFVGAGAVPVVGDGSFSGAPIAELSFAG